MPVYDDEQQKTGISDAELRSITGVQPDEEQAMEREAYNGAADDIGKKSLAPNELKDAESSADTPKSSDAEKKEGSSLPSGDEDGLFKDSSSNNGKFRVTKKQGIIGVIVGLLVGGGFGLMSILQGPLQIIHVAQLLQNFHFASNNQASSSRIGRMYEFIKTSGDDGDRSLRNVGYLAGKLSDKYITDLRSTGVELSFERQSEGKTTRRLQGLKVDPESPNGRNIINSLLDQGFNIDPDTGVLNFNASDRTKFRRSALNEVVNLSGKGKVSTAITKRLLSKRAGVDFHPLRNSRREAGESLRDYYKRRRDERAKNYRDGDIKQRYTTEGEEIPDEDNPDSTTRDPEASEAANDSNPTLDDIGDADGGIDTRNRLTRQLVTKVAGGAVAVAGVLCAVKDMGESVDEYKHAGIVLTMLRMSMGIVTIGSQIMTGQDVNIEEVGEVADTFYDDENQSSIMAAAGMQHISGEAVTGPDTDIKPGDAEERPMIFNIIDAIPGMGLVCGVDKAVTGFIKSIPLIGAGVEKLEEVGAGAINGILNGTFGITIDEFMENVVSWLSGDIVDPYAQGAELGNIVAIGGRLAANDAAITMGGTSLTNEQAYELRQLEMQDNLSEYNDRSFFARVFDLKDSRSVVASAIINTPTSKNTDQAISNIANLPTTILSRIGSSLSSLIPPASAQENQSYDFGVEAYGFSVSELESETHADPHEVASRVEPRLEELNEKYSKCFGTAVNPQNYALITNEAPTYDELKQWPECSESSNEFKDYRFYILDTITIRSMACYEGLDDQSCAELGIESSSNTRVAGTDNIPVVGDTADTPCYTGTSDLGTTDGYSNGERYTIRLCGIPGFSSSGSEDTGGIVRVNSTASENWLELFQAAEEDGLTLRASSSFRSNEEQTRLYNCYLSQSCNGGNKAASPGYSNHQMGIAVDIDIVTNAKDPSLTQCQASPSSYPVYQWLSENAGTWGFSAAIASECWHWSTTGR